MTHNHIYKTIGLIALVILSISSAVIGASLYKIAFHSTDLNAVKQNVMTIEDVATYLAISEGEVIDIIETEKKELQEARVFSGVIFPYYSLNKELYFDKESIDLWLKYVSTHTRTYDLRKRSVY